MVITEEVSMNKLTDSTGAYHTSFKLEPGGNMKFALKLTGIHKHSSKLSVNQDMSIPRLARCTV